MAYQNDSAHIQEFAKVMRFFTESVKRFGVSATEARDAMTQFGEYLRKVDFNIEKAEEIEPQVRVIRVQRRREDE